MQDAKIEALAAWFMDNGGTAPWLDLRTEHGLRGMFAKRDIADGELIFKAPRHLCLTVDTARHSQIGLYLHAAKPCLSDHAHLAVYLVHIRRHGGFWRPMVDVFPETFAALPMYFDKQDWALLQGSCQQRIAKGYWNLLKRECRIVNGLLPRSERLSLRDYAWGWWASATRSFTLSINGAKVCGMVPFADMLNHSPSPECTWSGDHSESFRLLATKSIAAGSSIETTYGARTNTDYLSQYGFCIDDNPNEKVRVRYMLPPDNFARELAPEMWAKYQVNTFDVERDPDAKEARRLFSFLRVSNLPDLATARATPELRDGNGTRVPALTLDNEKAALRSLIAGCEYRLGEFANTIEEDDRLLTGEGALSYRQRCAVRARRGEKRLLLDYIAMARKAQAALELPAPAMLEVLAAVAAAAGPFASYFAHLRERFAGKPATVTASQASDMGHHLHSQSWVEATERNAPAVVAQGDGAHVTDERGRRLLDAMSGLWCATLGYSERRLADAATRQLQRLPFQHTFGDRTTAPVAQLAERLVKIAPSPMAKAFFACSGSEMADTAVKIAWQYWAARGQPGRRKLIARRRAYHGSTVAGASLTGLPTMHQPFGLPLPGFIHVTCPHHYREALPGESEEQFSDRLAAELEETLLREGPDTVAAFFAEPVMAGGGVIVPPAGYFEKIQAVLRRHGVLLVADEVVCGFGRTGRYWGSQSVGMQPDMLICAKGLTAGYLPMSALLVSAPLVDALRGRRGQAVPFGHGYTYAGHPVAAAVALEAMTIYEERGIAARAATLGERLGAGLRGLASHPLVGEVRGMGMMWALELVADKTTRAGFGSWSAAWEFAQRAEACGVIVRSVADAILMAPPLIVSDQEIDTIVKTCASVLDDVAARAAQRQRRAA